MRLKNDAAEKYFLYAGIMKVKKIKLTWQLNCEAY